MKILIVLAIWGALSLLTLYIFHSWCFRPKKTYMKILRALKEGPKTPLQIAQIAQLSPKKLERILNSLEKKHLILRKAHPALRSPNAPDLIHLTDAGAMEIGPEN